MIRTLLILALILSATAYADPGSMSDAFRQGSTFGTGNNSSIKSNIQSGAAQSALPSATANVPQASYFGAPGLTRAGRSYDRCVRGERTERIQQPNLPGGQFLSNQSDRTSSVQPAAVRPDLRQIREPFSTTRLPSPATSLEPTAAVRRKPQRVLIFIRISICSAYRAFEQPVCSKILTVTVTDDGLSCAYGSWLAGLSRIAFIRPATFVGAACAEDIRFTWFYTYSECNGTDAYQYTTTIVPSDDFQVLNVGLGCGGWYSLWGSCPGGNCSYSVGSVYDNFVCDQYDNSNPTCDQNGCTYPCLQGHNETVYSALAGFNWQRPVHTYTITDAWNNQCATYEARLP